MNITDNSTDTLLLELLKRGNMSAFEKVFTRYYSTLCAYSRLFIRSGDVCENIVQELMLWIWENHSELHINDSLSRYLFTATRNRCLKHISHEMVERRVLDEMHKKLHGQFESPDFYIVREL
ncbi:MAG TPA: RNA polymerase sigma-70 factor, partial [Rikenellaceae bacterium]|nr:RNA polymerase sigma-70 factor [Rikenellaceae bacterium]